MVRISTLDYGNTMEIYPDNLRVFSAMMFHFQLQFTQLGLWQLLALEIVLELTLFYKRKFINLTNTKVVHANLLHSHEVATTLRQETVLASQFLIQSICKYSTNY